MQLDPPDVASELGRLRQIVAILARHGLEDLVQRLGWSPRLHRRDEATRTGVRDERPLRIRRALEELGPTFVKVGQVLAGRSDLLGPEWISELEQLQNHVPPAPSESIRAQLAEDLGQDPDDVFDAFDWEPVAAASIAQVHRARLKDGTPVAVKVRRPGIVPVVEADLRLMKRLAALTEKHRPELRIFRPVAWVDAFSRSMRRELDLVNECRQAERIASNFREDDSVLIPRVYWRWTHERVNVQQFVEGIPGDALDRVDAEGWDRRQLARVGARAVMKMIVQDGLFHADPHAGNVFYLAGHRVAFIDFGMVGSLSAQRRDELLRLLMGLTLRDADEVTEVLMEWVDGESAVQDARLSSDVQGFIDAYHGMPLAEIDLSRMLADVSTILRRHRLALPSDLALLFKAMVSAETMGRNLCPDFHLTEEALPLLRQTAHARHTPHALLLRGWRDARTLARLLARLPQDLGTLLRNIRHGGVQVHITVAGLQRAGDQLDRAASRLTVGVIVAALIVGSSIVMTVGGGPKLWGLPAFGLLGFLGACIGAAWVLKSIARGGEVPPE